VEKNEQIFIVRPDAEGTRLDQWLAAQMASSEEAPSRMQIQRWIKAGLVEGQGTLNPARRIEAGESFTVKPAISEKATDLEPIDLNLKILYQDDELAVIHKPAGIAVHPGPGDGGITLASGLIHAFSELKQGEWEGRPGIVHRLDKPTEGVLLVAKNVKAHRLLSGQFLRREVKKTYAAWLLACPPAEEGEINAAIKRHPKDRLRMRIDPTGRHAITRYKVTRTRVSRRGRKFALVEVDLLTGRTHQIRVHMAHIGCPIVGDEIYSRSSAEFKKFGLLLFAQTLEFKHPTNGSTMRFSLDLPERFDRFENSLEG
jgi:23S rRNA pseudouridine1911/1915/1917 synthase